MLHILKYIIPQFIVIGLIVNYKVIWVLEKPTGRNFDMTIKDRSSF